MGRGLRATMDGPATSMSRQLRSLIRGLEPPADLVPIDLSEGTPRSPPPGFVQDEIRRHARAWGRYPPIRGTRRFRIAVTEWLVRRYGLPAGMIDPDTNILPVAGVREALLLVALSARQLRSREPAPRILLPNPGFPAYHGVARAVGAIAELMSAPDAVPSLADVPRTSLEQACLAFLCSPANPHGSVADLDTLQQQVAVARKHGFIVASDECYSEIYDRSPPPGLLEACAAMGGAIDGVVVMQSLSKRSSASGLRSGFVAGDARVINALAQLRTCATTAPPLPLLAAATALWRDEAHVEAARALYRGNLDVAERVLAGRFGFYRPPGTFFLWLDVGDGEAVARMLWQRAGVLVVPGAYLARSGPDGRNPGARRVRCALVRDHETIREAMTRIVHALDGDHTTS